MNRKEETIYFLVIQDRAVYLMKQSQGVKLNKGCSGLDSFLNLIAPSFNNFWVCLETKMQVYQSKAHVTKKALNIFWCIKDTFSM